MRQLQDPEVTAGVELRRLRISFGWSQADVARQMVPYGYAWHQTMIAKIEAAQRPLRLNELVDLATMFGVLPFDLITPPQMTLGEIDAEIARLDPELTEASAWLSAASAVLMDAQNEHTAAAAAKGRVAARLNSLQDQRETLAASATAAQPIELSRS